jgi:DNA-binding SARP family transcriptional activator
MTKVLELALMGRLQVRLNGEPLSRLTSGKATALLCYLSVTGRPHPRHTLATLFWGNMADSDARRNLRGALMKLRQEIEPYLVISNETLAFNQQSDFSLDVNLFRENLARRPGDSPSPDSLRAALEIYRGDFLEDFVVRQAPGFDDWVTAQRMLFKESAVDACLSLTAHYADAGEFRRGIQCAQRLLSLDPVNEEGWRQLMLLLAMNGQRSAALAQYERCCQLLEKELGVGPSSETILLVEGIRDGKISQAKPSEEWRPSVTIAPKRKRPVLQESAGELPTFLAGPPLTHPGHFFGREKEVKRLFHMLQRLPLQNAAITGPRRSGKTSLLHYLRTITKSDPGQLRPGQRADWLPQPGRYRWIFVDFQDPRLGGREPLMRHFLTQMELPLPEPCDLERFLDVAAAGLDRPTVILLDEIGVALSRYPELDDAFWESLRSLATNQVGGQLGFVLASAESPDELAVHVGLGSPFFNIFGYTAELGPLSEAEAKSLIASSPLPFPAPDTEWILQTSDRWPILVQILCRERLLALEEGDTSDSWRDEGLRQMAPFQRSLARALR